MIVPAADIVHSTAVTISGSLHTWDPVGFNVLRVSKVFRQRLTTVCICAGTPSLWKGTDREGRERASLHKWSQMNLTVLQVYKALWQKQTIVAVKVMREQTEKAQQSFLKEIEVLCSLRHPNVVSFYGAYAQVRHFGNATGLSGSN